MQCAGLFSFVTALQIGARLWRDVLARKPEKPCKYCEFCYLMICYISSFLPDDPFALSCGKAIIMSKSPKVKRGLKGSIEEI